MSVLQLLTDKQMDVLFENLKDARLFSPIGTDRVKIRSGAMTGEWTYVGSLINPHAPSIRDCLDSAENFFYQNKRQSKELRERIAGWRKEYLTVDPSTLEVKMRER